MQKYYINSVEYIEDKDNKRCFAGDRIQIEYKGKSEPEKIVGRIDWFEGDNFIFTNEIDNRKAKTIYLEDIIEIKRLDN